MVERFLLHLGDREFDKVAADLAPKALVIIARERDGQWSNSFQTGDEWVAALKRNPNPTTFREPITNVAVTIDSDHLAYLRADFQIMRDGKAQSHGVDQFTLVRDGDAWKLAVIAFTSLPDAVIWPAAAIAAVLTCVVPGVARAPRDRQPCRSAGAPCPRDYGGPPGDHAAVVASSIRRTAPASAACRCGCNRPAAPWSPTIGGGSSSPMSPPGDQELYVSAVDFILVKRAVTVAAGTIVDIVIVLSEGTGDLRRNRRRPRGAGAGIGERREPAVAAEQTLGRRELQQLRGILTNDPLRAVQVLPAVAAGDDFRSEFAIRGAGIQHMTFTFEGIATPFLLHTVQEVHDSGSIAMVNGDVLEEISLMNGAYPQRHGNRLGAEIDFLMREGSRESVQSHLSVSAIDASARRRRPARFGKERVVAVLRAQELPGPVVERLYPEQNVSFGFTDAQAKFSTT